MPTNATAAARSFSEGIQAMVRTALSHMKLSEGIPESIAAGHSVLQVRFPVKLDNGHYQVFTGWRAGAQRSPPAGQRRDPVRSMGQSGRS